MKIYYQLLIDQRGIFIQNSELQLVWDYPYVKNKLKSWQIQLSLPHMLSREFNYVVYFSPPPLFIEFTGVLKCIPTPLEDVKRNFS